MSSRRVERFAGVAFWSLLLVAFGAWMPGRAAAVAAAPTPEPTADVEPTPGATPTPEAAPPPGAEPTPGATPAEDDVPPRVLYNEGLASLERGELDAAAEMLLKARDRAGSDDELRYRAAFNLGMALAHEADASEGGGAAGPAAAGPAPATPPTVGPPAGGGEDLQRAIDKLRESAAWFRDAVRLRPAEEDARVNLEVVLHRIQLLADQLNREAGKLEARLDRVIDDQRGLRDRTRQLLGRIEEAGAGAEPIGFQSEFEGLATQERTLMSEVGTISDLAGDELSLIDGKDEKERTDADRVRQVQLDSLDHYLQQARLSLSDASRLLRRLQGASAHRRADAALAELKRAREQLHDPITVLKSLVEDQTMVAMETRTLDGLRRGAIRIDGKESAAPPPWLTSSYLKDEQTGIAERTGEIQGRLAAAAEHAPGEGAGAAGAQPAPSDPRQERLLAAAREAVPHVEAAVEAMQGSSSALAADQLEAAAGDQFQAIDALLRAIERFAGVRELIELAYGQQSEVVALLSPPGSSNTAPGIDPQAAERLAELPTAERVRRVREGTARNRERMARLEGLLGEERKELEQQAGAAQAGAAAGQPGATPDAAQMEQRQAAIRQRYDLAEQHRKKAAEALDRLATAVDRLETGGAASAVAPARDALAEIEELRRLFFTIVEHLAELLRNQTETHDRTASLEDADDAARAGELGPLTERQERHAAIGDTLAQALEAQADAAQQSQGSGGEAAQAAEVLPEAAGEVRSASGEMQDASALIAEARDSVGSQSYDLEPILEHQSTAMEHLETAIRLLQPHSQQPQPPQEQQGNGEKQPRPQPSDEEEQMSQRQAERRLQAIRDREAERQRERERQKRQQPEPVEKDW